MPPKNHKTKRRKGGSAAKPMNLDDVGDEEAQRVNFEIGEHTILGLYHEKNEDCSVVRQLNSFWYLAVMDGHSAQEVGTEASQFAAKHLHWELEKNLDSLGIEDCITEAFVETDRKFSKGAEQRGSDSGSCALMCLLKGRHLIFGNAGDCRAVFFDGKPHQVTTDHNAKAREEKERVEDLGGFISEGRIFGELEPTRGLGDVEIRRIHMDLLIKSKSKSKSDSKKSPSPSPSPEPETEHERSRKETKSDEASSSDTHKKPDSDAEPKKETNSDSKSKESVSNADDSKNGRQVKRLDLAKIEGRRAPDGNPFCSVPYTLSELQEMRSVTEFAPEWSVVSSLPDISHWMVPESTEGSFLVIASDGVWTSLRNEQVCDIVKRSLNEKRGHGFAKAQAAARAVCEAAREAPMSYDDTTAIVVWFKN